MRNALQTETETNTPPIAAPKMPKGIQMMLASLGFDPAAIVGMGDQLLTSINTLVARLNAMDERLSRMEKTTDQQTEAIKSLVRVLSNLVTSKPINQTKPEATGQETTPILE
jgi:hypothetical protein